jgi:hypothetical protein
MDAHIATIFNDKSLTAYKIVCESTSTVATFQANKLPYFNN